MISQQSKTVLIVQIIQIISVIIAVLASGITLSAKLYSILAVLFFMGIGTWLTFYSINCMVFGNCNLFAWIIVGAILVYFVLAVIASVLGISAAKKYQAQLTNLYSQNLKMITPTQIGTTFTPPAAAAKPAAPPTTAPGAAAKPAAPPAAKPAAKPAGTP